jgi:hypothetical protein
MHPSPTPSGMTQDATHTSITQEAPSESNRIHTSPMFVRGLLVAFPLTTAMWIAVYLMVRVDF